MPFLDDAGVRDEPRGPSAAAFATFAGQVERLVAVNVLWSVHFAPGLVALAFPAWPPVLRLLLLAYSALALPVVTYWLFRVAHHACDDEYVGVPLVRETLRGVILPGLLSLGPLYAGVGLALWLVIGVPAPTAVRALAGWAALLLLLCSVYWGPALVTDPRRSAIDLLATSVQLTLRAPVRTCAVATVMLAVAAVGVLSVGGFFLAALVLVTLLQTQLYRHAVRTTGVSV